MSDFKRKLQKDIIIIVDTPTRASSYMGIHKSIYVKDVHKIDFEPFQIEDVEFNLIFNDMLVTMPGTFSSSTGETAGSIEDGTLFRLFRIKDGHIGVAMFVKGLVPSYPNKYAFLTSIDMDNEGMAFRDYSPRFRQVLEKNRKTIQDVLIQIIHTTAQFETKVIRTPPNLTYYRKLSAEVRATYIEYTLDLSKPRKVANSKNVGNKSDLENKAEFERRGHYRTSKYGKRFFVKQSTVNKGALRKIVKDYNLG